MTAYTARSATIIFSAMLMLLFSGINSHAHKVNIFAYAEGGKVHTESYFADGGRAANCRVTVEGADGEQLAEGMTDGEGRFSFDIPSAGDLKVVLHAGMGHQNDYMITSSELRAAMPELAPAAIPVHKIGSPVMDKAPVKVQAGTGSASPPSARSDATARPSSIDAEELRAIVDEAVEARLRPVYGMLAEMKEASAKPELTDVIGGIGYIMGIMGIILYFKSKRA